MCLLCWWLLKGGGQWQKGTCGVGGYLSIWNAMYTLIKLPLLASLPRLPTFLHLCLPTYLAPLSANLPSTSVCQPTFLSTNLPTDTCLLTFIYGILPIFFLYQPVDLHICVTTHLLSDLPAFTSAYLCTYWPSCLPI